MASEIRHMAIGLQGSGKTTFAAALWYLVDTREKGVTTVLSKGKHEGNFEYLEMLAAEWAECWRVPRTATGEHQQIAMNLYDLANDQEVVLQFVDLPGETYERAFATREVRNIVADAFAGVTGLMLFVNAAQARDDVTLLDVAKGLGENADETELIEEAVKTIKFDPAKTPRQVQIVDFIDSIQDLPMQVYIERVVLIVSAWDRAVETEPAMWLRNKMPLLDQYLANIDAEVRVYGVSAQGGVLPEKDVAGNQGDREALMAVVKASERIKIIGNGAGPHDLTHPVRWLSGLEGS